MAHARRLRLGLRIVLPLAHLESTQNDDLA